MGSFRYPVEEIRERCDLVEIISAHIALKKSGRTLVGICPFHSEKTPSFHVNPERKVWKCFGCGEGGDVFSFVQKIEGLTFKETVERLARKTGVNIEQTEQAVRKWTEKDRLFKANSLACTFFRKSLENSSKAREYLERRGLTQETVDKYKIGYAPDSWDSLEKYLKSHSISEAVAIKAGLVVPRERSNGCYDRFRDRLIFPIFDTSERVIAFGGRALGDDPAKYLNSPETPLFLKNRTLYGLNFARKAISSQDKVLIVEGYMDTIAAQEAGFENTIATMGTALTEEHVSIIVRFTKNVILSFDADSAGMNAALKSWPIFERAGFNIRILSMPKGEDPDSMLRGGDISRFAKLLERSLPVPDFRIKLELKKHNLKNDEGKAAALKGAAAIIAEVDSVVERERLIRLLAKYHPGFATGTTLAEDHLRSEVNSLRFRRERQARAPKAPVSREINAQKKLSYFEHSENLLLGIIILRNADAGKVFRVLPAKDFTNGPLRQLAEALDKQHAQMGKINQEMLRNEVAGTPAESLLNDILVTLDGPEIEHPVGDILKGIINRRKSERRVRMRALAQKIQEGTIKRGDEEYEEYWSLVKENSGPWRR